MRYLEDTKVSRGIRLRGIKKKRRQREIELQNVPEEQLQPQVPLLQNVMSDSQQVLFQFLIIMWAVSVGLFFQWWFNDQHVVGLFRFLLNTFMLMWTMVLPGYFFFFVYRMKRVNPDVRIPKNWRVAMVTTRAPSEPFSVAKKTLEAMIAQKFPHDNWLADEDPTEEIRQWCYDHKVNLSCRKGVFGYHNDTWPRRTKCKEGNLAYFYDSYGYESYDFVVQLDVDHVPEPGYLEAMLKPFNDDEVGYVSAPSICDANRDSSWSTRGRLYAEAIMHGPLQAGYTDGFAPLCIGSHYAVRTKALKEIGGLGPELAEDHSTTLMMNGHGWKGVHAFDATASGDGPQTLADCITQEFQWSRSLVVLLINELPKYWKKMPGRFKMEFLFSQLWYPLFALFMLVGHLLPIVAVVSRQPMVSVGFLDFLQHSLPVTVSILAIIWFLKDNGWLKPTDSPVFSWEAALFQIMRWPWALYGSVMGVVMAIRQKATVFKVTPKGVLAEPALNWSILYPYIACVVLSALPAIFIKDAGSAAGYNFFLIFNAIIYVVLLYSIIIIHYKETKRAAAKG